MPQPRPIPLHRRVGGAPSPQRHPDHQVLPQFIEKRAGEALSGSIDEADKNWKFSSSDIKERKYWKDYMRAYEECLSATGTPRAPWYAIPADDKDNARLI